MAQSEASGRSSGDMAKLMAEIDRYRTATEDALQQLDWCIGYFVGTNKKAIAKALGSNRAHIRRQIRRDAMDVPTTNDEGK